MGKRKGVLNDTARQLLSLQIWENGGKFDPIYYEGAFNAARPDHTLTGDSLAQQLSRFKHHAEVVAWVNDEVMRIAGRFKEYGKNVISEEKEKTLKMAAKLDNHGGYIDRSLTDLIRELNLIANDVTDAKLKSEILMKIADLTRAKETAEVSGNGDIMRFYVPLTCPDCPLYKAKQEELKQSGLIP